MYSSQSTMIRHRKSKVDMKVSHSTCHELVLGWKITIAMPGMEIALCYKFEMEAG